ncbi:MAG: phage/plasmid primase, P4 family, partial [Candidatus Kapabacteria bacterium]|nr:phage/plasmid primase, P4 family [Candidatus Kapabacteria bacterium]
MTVNVELDKIKLSINKNIINKPDKPTQPGWTNSDFTPNELIDHIINGFAFSQGVIKANKLNSFKPSASDIEEAWLIPVDIDNEGKVYSNGKYISKKLEASEGYFSFDDAIIDPWLKENALLIYTTPSHTEEHHRFRIVFLLEEAIKSPEEYTRISTALIDKFNSDKSCKNIDRMFYGNTNAEVIPFCKTLEKDQLEILLNSVSNHSAITADVSRAGELNIPPSKIAEILSYIPKPKKIRNRLKQPTISTLLHFAKMEGMDISQFFATSNSKTVVTSSGSLKTNAISDKDTAIMNKLKFTPYTDMGNAERFVLRYGDKVRYNFTSGGYYLYNGRYWEKDEVSKVYKLAKSTVRAISEEAKFVNSEFHEAIKKHSKHSEAKGKIEAMLSLAKQEEKIACKQSDFDKNLYLLNCENMVFDLLKNEPYPHKPEMMLSKQAPVKFEPETDCYAFDDFLEVIFNRDFELIRFVQRAIGLSLCGAHLEEVLFFALGSGKNGKSVFFKVIEMILGDYYQNAPAGMLLQNRFQKDSSTEVARLPNARFVIASELPEKGYLNESKVKDLTGGDTITARFLYQNEFSFKPTHTLWIFGNHKPKITGTDNGIWRRICLIPFTVTISEEKRIPQAELMANFEHEKSGILNWMIKGWQDYQQNGLNPPEVVLNAVE